MIGVAVSDYRRTRRLVANPARQGAAIWNPRRRCHPVSARAQAQARRDVDDRDDAPYEIRA